MEAIADLLQQALFLLDTYLLRFVLVGAALSLSVAAALHALIYKRESRSASLWVSFIFLSPFLGAIAYYILGINRVQKKASKLKLHDLNPPDKFADVCPTTADEIQNYLAKNKGQITLGDNMGFSPLSSANIIEPLNTGGEAYPAMLEAIEKAQTSITLLSYIFDRDEVGLTFVYALNRAAQRGVEIRVLVDDVGTGFLWQKVTQDLKKHNIPAEVFLPINLVKTRFTNLRNHRKLMVVDGKLAFTGGLNISKTYDPRMDSEAVLDLHFKVSGGVVPYIQKVFADDWYFTTGEQLEGAKWFPEDSIPTDSPGCLARVVPDGPTEDSERIRWLFLGAIQSAEKSIKILTPYFLPDSGLVAALCTARLRGVEVDILQPVKSDHAFLKWATRGSLAELLKADCKVWYTPPPFDHSKLFIVDDHFVSFGSANWDPRSLRLNFEMNVEAYSSTLARSMLEIFNKKKSAAQLFTLEELNARSLPTKVIDGFSRLFSPFL